MYKPRPERNLQLFVLQRVERLSNLDVVTLEEVYRDARLHLPDMAADADEHRAATRRRTSTMRNTVAMYLTKLVSVGALVRAGVDTWIKIRHLPREMDAA